MSMTVYRANGPGRILFGLMATANVLVKAGLGDA